MHTDPDPVVVMRDEPEVTAPAVDGPGSVPESPVVVVPLRGGPSSLAIEDPWADAAIVTESPDVHPRPGLVPRLPDAGPHPVHEVPLARERPGFVIEAREDPRIKLGNDLGRCLERWRRGGWLLLLHSGR